MGLLCWFDSLDFLLDLGRLHNITIVTAGKPGLLLVNLHGGFIIGRSKLGRSKNTAQSGLVAGGLRCKLFSEQIGRVVAGNDRSHGESRVKSRKRGA